MYPTTRYHSISIVLHWLIALGILFMLASGIAMVNIDMPKADQYQLFQIHKASGVIMLWAIVLRIVVRLFSEQPPLPAMLSAHEQKLAKLGHIGLYTALVVMPLSGWLMVSASPFGLPTFVFVDWIKWPHIPFVERNKTIESLARNIHWLTAIALGMMILGHIAAVIMHKKRHGLQLITRMWWSK
ncbi:cytochrome b [Alteromonas gilva]|uniref:Cytochrome b n=1 Tax=Alteromonas gilva TaxID=2987522 RepID=A0ABT5L2N1_9ALTE|nr:cytochrome b [Alteromonas gilva]MDC8831133.1 cytochrome b [Alteromonas gilva]